MMNKHLKLNKLASNLEFIQNSPLLKVSNVKPLNAFRGDILTENGAGFKTPHRLSTKNGAESDCNQMLNCHRDLDDVVGCVVSDEIRSQLKLEREGWSLSDAALASGTGEDRRGAIL